MDYHLEVNTIGHQIMEWWAEISPSGGVPSIRFGGSTGIYSLVVLMSWWCRLLKDEPDAEHADCLHTLTDIDRVLSATIDEIKNNSPSSAPTLSATTPVPSRRRKRVDSGTVLPRKRGRAARV